MRAGLPSLLSTNASVVSAVRNGRHLRPDVAGDPKPGDRLVVLNDGGA